MPKVIRREVRRRGFFGKLFLLLFVLFNAAMLAWLVAYWSSLGDLAPTSDAERAGAAIGITIGTGILFFFWVAGDIILGLFALLTRGRVTVIEEVAD